MGFSEMGLWKWMHLVVPSWYLVCCDSHCDGWFSLCSQNFVTSLTVLTGTYHDHLFLKGAHLPSPAIVMEMAKKTSYQLHPLNLKASPLIKWGHLCMHGHFFFTVLGRLDGDQHLSIIPLTKHKRRQSSAVYQFQAPKSLLQFCWDFPSNF